MKNLVKLALENKAQQHPKELEKLLIFLDSMQSKKIAVEIGSYNGGCLHAYKEIFEKTISIDLEIRSRLKEVDYIIGDSKKALPLLKETIGVKNTKIDFLMIDGDHSYEGVKADFNLYHKLVRKGGIIAFHDILDTQLHRELFCRVDLFWNEINKDERFEAYEIIESDGVWGGIGILVVK
ncbi:Methyltransferase domain containing protein [uncultured Caudovirales phage]|uniref:Methyltransferase domain containing protein n=1 Tax=uncultured Caudovirales phage TaxID=2100421 RepID=A0A6J5MVS1_9CAUD|nr:Methyltransferase domain containing protein [uncultured Caudovirales phage]